MDSGEQSYIVLESQVRCLKNIIFFGFDELKIIVQCCQDYKLYFSLEVDGIQLKFDGLLFNDDLYFVVGFFSKQFMVFILEVEFILGFMVFVWDLKWLLELKIFWS